MKELKNIVVAIDSNDSVGDLLSYSETLAKSFLGKIWIIHVAEPNPDFVGYQPGPQYIRDMKADELRDEHRNLQALCNAFLDKEIESEALLIQGPTVESVLEEAEKLNADLLVVGTHKHGFFHNLFAESVSQELFKKANLPLLAIPIEDE